MSGSAPTASAVSPTPSWAPSWSLALGRAAARALPARTLPGGPRHPAVGPAAPGGAVGRAGQRGGRRRSTSASCPLPASPGTAPTRSCPAAVISASHNPFADNGIKLFAAGGLKLPDATEAAVEEELARVLGPAGRRHRLPTATASAALRRSPTRPAATSTTWCGSLDGRSLDGPCGSWWTAPTAPPRPSPPRSSSAWARRSHAIADRPDGTNINDGCGSTHPEALAAEVVARGRRARPGPRRRRRPAGGGGPHRCGRHRRRVAGPLRHRPGRPGPAGRQHRRRHGHDQPRVPSGHGRAGHRRARDRRSATAMSSRRSTPTGYPRRASSRAHRLPAAGHDRRRRAHRRPAGSTCVEAVQGRCRSWRQASMQRLPQVLLNVAAARPAEPWPRRRCRPRWRR